MRGSHWVLQSRQNQFVLTPSPSAGAVPKRGNTGLEPAAPGVNKHQRKKSLPSSQTTRGTLNRRANWQSQQGQAREGAGVSPERQRPASASR